MKKVFSTADQALAEAIARLNGTNPFLPARVDCERAALGAEFVEAGCDWNTRPPSIEMHPNHRRLVERCEAAIARARAAWPERGKVPTETVQLYVELVGFWLYQTYSLRFDDVIRRAQAGERDALRPGFYRVFCDDVARYMEVPGIAGRPGSEATHLFACAFQIRRAFHHVFHSLVGGSKPMARLRAEIWQSIFTHDLGRYRRVLFDRMGDFATLITGPSGTGKELVARAISFSRYVPYDPRGGGFSDSFAEGFFPLNLSALSPTLIESELFGHRRGAFTGAVADRAGWMEQCPATGSVFLDEIGDVDAGIQVKLLRVLQSRTFQRLGDTDTRHFRGKVIAATNRDLATAMRQGAFREDFYYRLCSDLIETPSLRAQLDDRPEDLAVMVDSIAQRWVDDAEAPAFAREARRWIEQNLGPHYPWPGNFRELEQCVRNVLIRGEYRPTAAVAGAAAEADWLTQAAAGEMTAEALLTAYTQQIFGQCGTLDAAALKLGVDRRTVRARLPAKPLKRGRR
ncbi:sigma 54-interacting transcriptional regulator [Actomonas aquatica]|uniref:Sigma 54-interacting transcriptional regulator n=1 Tax=Actomonas aquatica TaxID=2866162 RepID=A0ABZ1C775_9BACT|nr:sigma 54-interacting transcriptional regulator [Opitutus sp. WL0086]WRQ87316.1 sigma 54-interacting transcriptional regulator [Opitutus sp. WL0086]